jgi:RimJ/RimL family protein N-acetyltransferase
VSVDAYLAAFNGVLHCRSCLFVGFCGDDARRPKTGPVQPELCLPIGKKKARRSKLLGYIIPHLAQILFLFVSQLVSLADLVRHAFTMASQDDLEFIAVKTTLPKIPYPATATRVPVHTARLTIRPLTDADMQGLFALRSQPEVMCFTGQGKVDGSMEHTRAVYARYLPPGDQETYNFGIFLRDGGTLVGVGGSHLRIDRLGWPAVGYMLAKEAWGQGYGTEFLRAFMGMWWGLEREAVEARVERGTVVAVVTAEGGDAREVIVGSAEPGNERSVRVMEKCGFRKLTEWTCPPSLGGEIRLAGFGALRPGGDGDV